MAESPPGSGAVPGWRLAPRVIRLSERRIAGGAPFRVVRLSDQAEAELGVLLGTTGQPAPGSRMAALLAKLVRYGLLLGPSPEHAVVGPGEITVVIPALSTAAAVTALLRRIPAHVGVVVVDDGSQPPLAGGLPARSGLQVIRHPVARGPAAARNAGARHASTPWIAFVDADITPPDSWLAELLARANDPATVAVAPRILSAAGRGAAGFLEHWAGALDLGEIPSDAAPGFPVSYVPSAALLVRRETFDATGGFDERLQVGEDVDLIWRLSRAGRIRYEPDVVCRHQPRPSARAVIRRRFEYGTSAAALARRHPGALRHVDVSVWSFVPWLLGIAVHPLAGAGAAVSAVAVAPLGLRELPRADAWRLAVRGHRQAFEALGRWLVRPMWPLTAVVAVTVPRRRTALVAALALGAAGLARRPNPAVSPSAGAGPRMRGLPPLVQVLTAACIDDLSYSAGVWAGCVRERTIAPLVPRVRVTRNRRRPR